MRGGGWRRRSKRVRDEDPVVLGIPRGGVVVAHEIATVLGAPLDVVVVRKLGYPGHEEAGFGALGEDDVLVPESLAELEPGEPGFDAFRDVDRGEAGGGGGAGGALPRRAAADADRGSHGGRRRRRHRDRLHVRCGARDRPPASARAG